MQKKTSEDWVIVPNPYEAVKSQSVKGRTTKSVGFSVVYPDGDTGYLSIGKIVNGTWQPYGEINEIVIKWK